MEKGSGALRPELYNHSIRLYTTFPNVKTEEDKQCIAAAVSVDTV